MSKLLCAWVLLLFSAAVGPAAQAPMQWRTEPPTMAEIPADVVAGSPAHCCPDALAPHRVSAPCPVDCGFLAANCMIDLPFGRPAHAAMKDAPLPSAVSERPLRPPIG